MVNGTEVEGAEMHLHVEFAARRGREVEHHADDPMR
jgi:hypothetical protein